MDDVLKLVTTLTSSVGSVFAGRAQLNIKRVRTDLEEVMHRLDRIEALLREIAEQQTNAAEARVTMKAQLDIIEHRIAVLEEAASGRPGFGEAGLASA